MIKRHYSGMSLRDWYAGMALPEVYSMMWSNHTKSFMNGVTNYISPQKIAEIVAVTCFTIADAMIAERKKVKK